LVEQPDSGNATAFGSSNTSLISMFASSNTSLLSWEGLI
jgi:hypothetical protein